MNRSRHVLLLTALLLLAAAPLLLTAQAPTGKKEVAQAAPKAGDVIENSIGMKLVYVPPGKFRMGSPAGEKDRKNREGPQHEVTLTKGFYLGKYEVTQEEYQKVMGKNPSYFCADGPGSNMVVGKDTKRYPVEQVSWEDAVAFCRKLRAKEGKEYRLPTEAEWEYACRGKTTTPFHFGSILNGAQANCDGRAPYGTTEKGAHLGRTTEVGSYAANAFGLCDMHGNVWEWCADWYNDKEYQRGDCIDPTGPANGSGRVDRGGSWGTVPVECRSAFRGKDEPADRDGSAPSDRHVDLGFRLCLSSVVK